MTARPVPYLRLILPLLLALGASGCTSTYSYRLSQNGFLIATRPEPGGGEATYRLYPGDGATPKVHRTTTVTYQGSRLGVVTRQINGRLAEELGVQAWRGVVVDTVLAEGAAARAGLVRGDVLRSIEGTEISGPEHLGELLDTRILPGQPVEVVVLRGTSPGSDRQELRMSVSPEPKEITESQTDAFALTTSPGVQRLTGMQLGELAGDLAEEVYGSPDPVVLVAGVVTGSPAYFAGIRGGDRVVDCDGAAVRTLRDVRDAVFARASRLNLPPNALDSDELASSGPSELRVGPIALRVTGPLGAHVTTVEVVGDLDGSTKFKIPILIDVESDVQSREVSFLQFIFQFGFNYERRWLQSGSRGTARHSELSVLPLGMFEYETGPRYDRYRLFWIINFRTRK